MVAFNRELIFLFWQLSVQLYLPVEFVLSPRLVRVLTKPKNRNVDKQIEILLLIALGTTGWMMARGLVKPPIHKNIHLLDFVFVVY
jgi:hypothetical protein